MRMLRFGRVLICFRVGVCDTRISLSSSGHRLMRAWMNAQRPSFVPFLAFIWLPESKWQLFWLSTTKHHSMRLFGISRQRLHRWAPKINLSSRFAPTMVSRCLYILLLNLSYVHDSFVLPSLRLRATPVLCSNGISKLSLFLWLLTQLFNISLHIPSSTSLTHMFFDSYARAVLFRRAV